MKPQEIRVEAGDTLDDEEQDDERRDDDGDDEVATTRPRPGRLIGWNSQCNSPQCGHDHAAASAVRGRMDLAGRKGRASRYDPASSSSSQSEQRSVPSSATHETAALERFTTPITPSEKAATAWSVAVFDALTLPVAIHRPHCVLVRAGFRSTRAKGVLETYTIAEAISPPSRSATPSAAECAAASSSPADIAVDFEPRRAVAKFAPALYEAANPGVVASARPFADSSIEITSTGFVPLLKSAVGRGGRSVRPAGRASTHG